MVDISPDITIRRRIANEATGTILILISLVSIAVIWLTSINIFSPSSIMWLPLGIILATILANPITELEGIVDAIAVILMYLNVMSFILVFFPDQVKNTTIIGLVIIIGIVIIEFPRRFTGGEESG